ncbi:MAG: hypothetical protein JWO05_864 [Gemmatimonadetes bacterium]|nr:hypothetical protein [Gemmatimonadota bacterium]
MEEVPWRDSLEDDVHPAREPERERVRDDLDARLAERGVTTDGTESDDMLATLMDEVEQFESAVARLGGDSFVNTPDSSQPENARFVIPARLADERVEGYVARIREATEALGW